MAFLCWDLEALRQVFEKLLLHTYLNLGDVSIDRCLDCWRKRKGKTSTIFSNWMLNVLEIFLSLYIDANLVLLSQIVETFHRSDCARSTLKPYIGSLSFWLYLPQNAPLNWKDCLELAVRNVTKYFHLLLFPASVLALTRLKCLGLATICFLVLGECAFISSTNWSWLHAFNRLHNVCMRHFSNSGHSVLAPSHFYVFGTKLLSSL